jgi:hypothetical protein
LIPRAYRQQSEFASAVAEVGQRLVPRVVRIRHTLGDDWSGEPAVFFRIVLPDDACERQSSGRVEHHDRFFDITSQICAEIVQQIEPLEQWGVLPYFNFRSESEQAQLKDSAWA